ncbi:MAG: HEAT repeat domain-containing protein [Gemmatimonadetes bacterium]|nr:HEAT repeat domain-containing protein [Gemmatimonadota bacterium]
MTLTSLLGIGTPSGPTLLLVLKATTILLVTVMLAGALHKAAAGVRHLVWLVAIAAVLLLPALSRWMPLDLPVLPAAASVATVTPPTTGEAIINTAAPSQTQSTPTVTTSAATAGITMPSLGTMLIGLWAVVAVLLIARLIHGTLAVQRIVRNAQPLADDDWNDRLYDVADRLGIARAPRVVKSESIHVPFATGLLNATIVLPAECDTWTPGQRDAVLIHELGHVRRRDLLGHTLGRVACAVYWFHPLVWTAARRLRDASERACDDLAIRLGSRPSEYAEHLLQIVTAVGRSPVPSVALAMAQRKEFEGRMLAILDPALRREAPPRWQVASITGALMAMSLLVAAAAPAPAPAQAKPLELANTATKTVLADPPQDPLPVAKPAPKASPEPATAPDGKSTVVNVNPNVRINVRTQGELPAEIRDANPELLAKILRTDSSAEVRRVAAWGLHDHADVPVAFGALSQAAERDADADVRTMAVWALESSRDSKVTELLGRVLARDSDADAREMAAWALGQFADPSAAAPLAAALAKESSDHTLGTIAWAIGNVPMDRAPAKLTALLTNDSKQTRLMAAWALSNIADKTTLPAIRAALKQPQDGSTTRALLRAAMAMDPTPDGLSDLLTSADPGVRAAAVAAMSGKRSIDPWPWPWPRPRPNP